MTNLEQKTNMENGAVRLYGSGLSLAKVATALGSNATCIGRILKRQRINLRITGRGLLQ